jgi:hypothetical protein
MKVKAYQTMAHATVRRALYSVLLFSLLVSATDGFAAIPLITDDTGTEVVKSLKLAGDIGVETNPDKSSNTPPAYVLGGLIYSVSENFDVGFGIKGGLTRPETDIAVRGGITGRF